MNDEIGVLCLLHNIGAIYPEKSLTDLEIANCAVMEIEMARLNLQKLMEANYIQTVMVDGNQKYHITVNGIRKVLSIYS